MPDRAVAEHLLDGLGDHPRRVREVDQPGVAARARRSSRPAAPSPGSCAARSRCRPARSSPGRARRARAGRPRRPRGPRAGRRGSRRTRSRRPRRASTRSVVVRNGSCVAVLGREPVEHGADPVEPVGVDVVQHDLLEAEPLRLLQQRAVDERHAEPAAADDRELHATVTSIPAASTAERHGAGSGASVTTCVDRLRPAHAHDAAHRELGGVGDQHDHGRRRRSSAA